LSELESPAKPGATHTLVHLAGDLDLATAESVGSQLEAAVDRGLPVIVDVGDCTFVGADVLRTIAEGARRAELRGQRFIVVLPYSADRIVRRTLLEIAPELAAFAIAPSVQAATAAVARAREPVTSAGLTAADFQALRASLWENAARFRELAARRDALLFEARVQLAKPAARGRRSA
jgi:anti-anti-sigma factor